MLKVKKAAGFLLVCLMVLCILSLPSSAEMLEEYGMDLDLFLTYLNDAEEEMSIYPDPAGMIDDAVALWGFLPDSNVEEVTLHVSDVNGLYMFTPDEGTDLQVTDAGSSLSGYPLCEIDAVSEDGEEIRLIVFLSRTTEWPEDAEPDEPEDTEEYEEPDLTDDAGSDDHGPDGFEWDDSEPDGPGSDDYTDGFDPDEAEEDAGEDLAGEDPAKEEPAPEATDVPAPEAVPVQTAYPFIQVTVHFVDENGNQIAPDRIETVWIGRLDAVYAENIEGYTRIGDVAETLFLPEGTTEAEDITFVYQAPRPDDAVVVIRYLDNAGRKVAEDTSVVCPGGETTVVEAAPADLPENYRLEGSAAQAVYVDFDGPHPESPVTFYYSLDAGEEDGMVTLTVRYLSGDGTALAQEDLFVYPSGETVTLKAPETIQDDDETMWVLTEEPARQIEIADDGTGTQETVFIYRPVDPEKTEETTEAPEGNGAPAQADEPSTDGPELNTQPAATQAPAAAPTVKLVQVLYQYEDDTAGYSSSRSEVISEGEVLIFAEEPRAGYQLQGEDYQLVTVYADGTVEPETVVFRYVRIALTPAPDALQTTVPVYYMTEDGIYVCAPTYETIAEGTQTIYANPYELPDGYDLITEPQTVTLMEDGEVEPEEIVFYYRLTGQETTPEPDGKTGFAIQPYSGYARSLRNVNLRSYPDDSDSGNIITTVSPEDLIILEGITAYRGGNWYYVSVNGRMGYMSASVIKELTEAEVSRLDIGSIQREERGETAEEEDSGLIERWGKTNTTVRFRETPDGKVIRQLKKNTELFIVSSQEEGGVVWYSAIMSGRQGFIMEKYVDLMNASQSALKQSQLKTPVPTHTPAMTRIPTATPTVFVPTPVPTPEPIPVTPEPTATPPLYMGYGLTLTRSAVRSSLSLEDDAIREMVTMDTLVSIRGQTYVDGICWDSVQVVSSRTTGFMEDSVLQRISNSDAEYYLEELTTPTPAPVILNTPFPFEGLARTLGDYVPVRTDTNTNAEIITLLVRDAVMNVMGQVTSEEGVTWSIVQYGAHIGYVRRDMIVQMNEEEIEAYRASLRTATPAALETPTPKAPNQRITAYGVVQKDRVNLRAQPDAASTSVYMMSRNELVYILGSFFSEDLYEWYLVSINERQGYVRADYIEVLTRDGLESFLDSEEFRSANNSEEADIRGSYSLQAYEDHVQSQWQNPSASASFEPFDPYATAAPLADTVSGMGPEITLPPTPAPTIVAGFTDQGGEDRASSNGPGLGAILLIAGILVLLAGGIAIYVSGKRRAKARRRALRRAQQARAAARNGQAGETASYQSGYRKDGAFRPPVGSTGKPPAPLAEEQEEPDLAPEEPDRYDDPDDAFRRPEILPDDRSSDPVYRDDTAEEDPTSFQTDVTEEQCSPETPAPSQGRRRRTQRYHYDE